MVNEATTVFVKLRNHLVLRDGAGSAVVRSQGLNTANDMIGRVLTHNYGPW